MADPEISIAALLAGTGSPTRVFAGGGPGIPVGGLDDASERVLITLLLQRLQQQNARVHGMKVPPAIGAGSDEYRMVMGLPATSSEPHFAHWYTQGSHAVATHMRPLADGQRGQAYDFDLLDTCRSDVASVARFAQRVDFASYHLAAAYDGSDDAHSWRPAAKRGVQIAKAYRSYFSRLAEASFERWHTVRSILIHDWTPTAEAEPLCRAAYWSLCELTPADQQLKILFVHDADRARHELVRHVDVVAEQLALTASLSEDLSAESAAADKVTDAARLDALQEALLDKAGARLTLTEASERLGISRQALYKKIKTGAALGLMIGDTFVVPEAQLVAGKDGSSVVAHLRDVLSLFTEAGAGGWSALEYLIEPDPALGGDVPLDRLKAGDAKLVVAAARAYLGLDAG